MRKTVKAFVILGLVVGFVFSLNPSQVLAYQMARQVLDGGGAMWLETANYKLSSSLGQSIIGLVVRCMGYHPYPPRGTGQERG